jgi:hypothetical protein
VRTCVNAADPDELLEVLGDELRAVVRNEPGVPAGKPLARPLNDRLDVNLGHGLADFPVDDEAAAAVEEAAKIRVYFQIDSQLLMCRLLTAVANDIVPNDLQLIATQVWMRNCSVIEQNFSFGVKQYIAWVNKSDSMLMIAGD